MKLILLLAILMLTVPSLAQAPKIGQAGWTSDGQYLVTTGEGRELSTFDGRDGRLIKSVSAKGDSEVYVSFSPDSGRMQENGLTSLVVSGNIALTASTDYSLQWWSIPDLNLVQETTSSYGVLGLSLANEGRTAAYNATSTRYLDSSMEWIKWTADGLVAQSFTGLSSPDSSTFFGVPQLSPDGRWALAALGGEARLWNLEQPEQPSVALQGVTASGLAMGQRHFYHFDDEQIVRRAYQDPHHIDRSFASPGAGGLTVDLAERHLVGFFHGGLWIWDLMEDDNWRQWTVEVEDITLCPNGEMVGLWKEKWFEVWDLKSRALLFKLARI